MRILMQNFPWLQVLHPPQVRSESTLTTGVVHVKHGGSEKLNGGKLDKLVQFQAIKNSYKIINHAKKRIHFEMFCRGYSLLTRPIILPKFQNWELLRDVLII